MLAVIGTLVLALFMLGETVKLRLERGRVGNGAYPGKVATVERWALVRDLD
jgi:hypothetical protein